MLRDTGGSWNGVQDARFGPSSGVKRFTREDPDGTQGLLAWARSPWVHLALGLQSTRASHPGTVTRRKAFADS